MLSIKTSGFDKLRVKLSKKPTDPLRNAVFEIAALVEKKAKLNINQRIYGQPPSPRYTRSGAAQKGFLNRQLDTQGLRREVMSDARLSYNPNNKRNTNYTPFLNQNKRIKRFNTGFWDDAVDDGRTASGGIIQKHTKKHYGK